jgi:hypothetical protein
VLPVTTLMALVARKMRMRKKSGTPVIVVLSSVKVYGSAPRFSH